MNQHKQVDPITWRLLLCCVIAASGSGWMLYYLFYEAPAAERNFSLLSIPVLTIIMSITILVLNEKYRRRQLKRLPTS